MFSIGPFCICSNKIFVIFWRIRKASNRGAGARGQSDNFGSCKRHSANNRPVGSALQRGSISRSYRGPGACAMCAEPVTRT